MGRVCRIGVVLIAIVVGLAQSASATPIGRFDYDGDPFFGPLFRVENNSGVLASGGSDFTDVTVHLRKSGDATDVASFLLGDIAPFGTANTFDPLSYDFDSAILTFDFVVADTGSIDPTTLILGNITSETVFVTVPIEFVQPADTTPTPVPEPATLLLTSIGAGIAVYRRRTTEHRR